MSNQVTLDLVFCYKINLQVAFKQVMNRFLLHYENKNKIYRNNKALNLYSQRLKKLLEGC